MFPELFKVGGLTLHAYGLMIALGMLFGFEYVIRKARKSGMAQNLAVDLFFYIVIAGLLGGRVFYVATNWQLYSQNMLDAFKVWEGGLVFYGGLIFSFIAAVAFIRVKKMDFWTTADLFAPAIPLAHFFGRLGCLFAGCCYGKECRLPWSVTFKNPKSLAPLNVPLHPTQAYEAAANLVIFIVLAVLAGKKSSAGKIFLLYVLMYSAARFGVEFFRGDERGAFILGFSPAQAISLVFFVCTTAFWLVKYQLSATKNFNGRAGEHHE